MPLNAKAKNSESDFYKSLKERRFAPVYFFHGAEEYLIQQYVDDLVSAALSEVDRDFNLTVLYARETDGATLINTAAAFPMMAERRVVVAKEVHELQEQGRALLLKYILKPSPTTCLVLTSSESSKAAEFIKKVSAAAFTLEAKPLYENQVGPWLEAFVKKRGLSITREAAMLLQSEAGSSLRQLVNEIDKVELRLQGRRPIEVADVEAVVGRSRQFTVFELRDAVAERNLKKALRILKRLLDYGERPIGLLAALSAHFAALAKAKEMDRRTPPEEMARILRTAPFFCEKYLRQAALYSSEQLATVFELLMQADQQLKSSYLKPEMVLQLLIVEITSLKESEARSL